MGARSWTDEQLVEAVKTSNNGSEVARKLGLSTYGANSRTIKKRIEVLELDTSHFLNASEQLKIARLNIKSMSHEEMFSINDVDRRSVKATIIKDELLPYKCSECGIDEWQGKSLSLHLDHINGVNNDNRLENLRFLCPNCHSLTDTYCGKQLRGVRYAEHKCVDCGTDIYFDATRCRKCSAKHKNTTKILWPTTDILVKMVEELGYRGAAKQLGVSDHSVKKRIRNHPI